MYDSVMKRIEIVIDDELDGALEQLAADLHTSKSALVQRFVRDRILPLPPLDTDPILKMAGADDFDPLPVDDVVYP
jgi:hypothetical protein